MRVVAFFIAERAVTDNGLNVQGGFRNLFSAPAFPIQAEVAIVIALEQVPSEEEAEAQLDVAIIGPNGEVVGQQLRAEFNLGSWAPPMPIGIPIYAPTAVPMALTLPEPGTYRAVLSLDGEEVADYTFHAHFP